MMGHGFSRQITKKCGTKYGNGNYILGHPKWKWELYFGTEGVVSSCILPMLFIAFIVFIFVNFLLFACF